MHYLQYVHVWVATAHTSGHQVEAGLRRETLPAPHPETCPPAVAGRPGKALTFAQKKKKRMGRYIRGETKPHICTLWPLGTETWIARRPGRWPAGSGAWPSSGELEQGYKRWTTEAMCCFTSDGKFFPTGYCPVWEPTFSPP